jgi:hypothetical protein
MASLNEEHKIFNFMHNSSNRRASVAKGRCCAKSCKNASPNCDQSAKRVRLRRYFQPVNFP